MTQKTNQFNLTTKRYTESEIHNFINDPNCDVLAFSVTDKFGESGVTGLCILTQNSNIEMMEIDTLLMSCRIIGRNIENAFMDYIIERLKEKKKKILLAKYIKTTKNNQVKKFYEKCSFERIEKNNLVCNYTLDLKNYKVKQINYIEVNNGN
jgi:FkbH-like protein